MNHVLHVAAIVQIRHDTEGRAYYRRKLAAGKSPLEALRCLKRRLSDVVYRQLVADARHAEQPVDGADPGGHCGASLASSAVDLPPHIDTSDQPQPGSADTDATADPARCEPFRGLDSQPSAAACRSRQGGAPHRTNDLDGDKRRRTLEGTEATPLTQRGTRCGNLPALCYLPCAQAATGIER